MEKLKQKSDPVSAFLYENLSDGTKETLDGYPAKADAMALLPQLVQDLNNVVKQDPNKIIKDGRNKGKKPEVLADPQRLKDVALAADTQAVARAKDDREEARGFVVILSPWRSLFVRFIMGMLFTRSRLGHEVRASNSFVQARHHTEVRGPFFHGASSFHFSRSASLIASQVACGIRP